MRTQSTDRRIPHIPCQRASITHIVLTITFVAIIGLPSLLTTPLPGRASGRLSPTPTPTAGEEPPPLHRQRLSARNRPDLRRRPKPLLHPTDTRYPPTIPGTGHFLLHRAPRRGLSRPREARI